MAAQFPTTQRGRLDRAGDSIRREALEPLCRDYWFPLYAFIRHRGHDPDRAEDLVQGFLADLLERGDLGQLEQTRGRFRSFLRAACDHYLANQRDQDRAVQRNGGAVIVPIDRPDAEGRYTREPSRVRTPGRLFEQQWALVLLARVLDRLEAECRDQGKDELFRWLKPALQGDGLVPNYLAIGGELCMTENAVRGAARRMRLRYRELLREEVTRTIVDPEDVDEEIGELMIALSGG